MIASDLHAKLVEIVGGQSPQDVSLRVIKKPFLQLRESNVNLYLRIIFTELTKYIFASASETCYDGIQNQDEIAVDCGGSWCKPCGITKISI